MSWRIYSNSRFLKIINEPADFKKLCRGSIPTSPKNGKRFKFIYARTK
jgi:hypothetical protein